MNSEIFDDLVHSELKAIDELLVSKNGAYNPDEDKLSTFRRAAALQGKTLVQAVGDMMSKHTVSIYGMISSGRQYDIEIWNEKIRDHGAYLILLKAAVINESFNGANLTALDIIDKAYSDKIINVEVAMELKEKYL